MKSEKDASDSEYSHTTPDNHQPGSCQNTGSTSHPTSPSHNDS